MTVSMSAPRAEARSWVEPSERLRDVAIRVVRHTLIRGSRVYGLDSIPPIGGAVLAMNHFSAIDPPLVASLVPRSVRFMMKSELERFPYGHALALLGGFPVKRGAGDRVAFTHACNLVRDGHLVGMCVEGTRQPTKHVAAHIHRGAIAVAVRAGVPIIPCGIASFEWSVRRQGCCLVIGPQLRFVRSEGRGKRYELEATLLRREMCLALAQAQDALRRGFLGTVENESDGSLVVPFPRP